MENLDDLKKDLERGDYPMIHKMTNVSEALINAIFQKNRNADTPKGRKVLAAAKKLIETRKQLLASTDTEELGDTPSRNVA